MIILNQPSHAFFIKNVLGFFILWVWIVLSGEGVDVMNSEATIRDSNVISENTTDIESATKLLMVQIIESKNIKRASLSPHKSMLTVIQYQVKDRKETLLQLIDADPSAFMRIVLPDVGVKSIPLEVQSSMEQSADLEGTLSAMVEDNFESNTAKTIYILRTSKEKSIFVYFTKQTPDILTGSQVKIHGLKIDKHVVIDSLFKDSMKLVQEPVRPKALGAATGLDVKKIAVILMRYQDSPPEPFSIAYARGILFRNSDSVRGRNIS